MIDEKGQNLGVLEIAEALRLTESKGLDLIEIAPTANPPVCRIMEFGKFKYLQERETRGRVKKQHESEVKGIRLGFTTGRHDMELRARQAEKFLQAGDKVRVDLRLRGREKAHGDVALRKLEEFLSLITLDYHLESPPKRFPQGFVTIIRKK